jgi:phosphatidylglycerophosphate synthase
MSTIQLGFESWDKCPDSRTSGRAARRRFLRPPRLGPRLTNVDYPERQTERASREAPGREAAAIVATILRLLLVWGLIRAYGHGVAAPLIWLGIIVIADVLDGILARRFLCDSDHRRMADSVVDRISIHTAFLSFVSREPQLVWFYLPLVLRDAINSIGSGQCLRRRKALIIGGGWHKLASLADAALGASFILGGVGIIWVAATFAWLSNYVLLADYIGAYFIALARPPYPVLRRDTVRGLTGCRALVHVAGGADRARSRILPQAEVVGPRNLPREQVA